MFSNYNIVPGGEDDPSAVPVLVAIDASRVLFTNTAFKERFKILSHNLSDIHSDPSLQTIISSFIVSALQSFSIDIYINPIGNFRADLSKITLKGEEFIFISFYSLNELSFIEDKINLLTTALENEKMPLMLTDDKGHVIFSTSSFESVLNKGIDLIYHKNIAEIFSSFLSAEDLIELTSAVNERKKWSKIAPTSSSGGKRIYREFSLLPVRYQSSSTSFIITAYDVSDQQFYKSRMVELASKETKLLKMKTALLENMSHEIRTPLTAIKGYSEIIDDCLREGDYESLQEVSSNLKDVLNRVLALFTNIAEVSQIEFGEVSFDFVKLNLKQILKSIYNKKAEEYSNEKIKFTLSVPEEDINVTADWIKLDRIITLLLENAFKYTSEGEISIKSYSGNYKAVLIISDTGTGIDEKDLSRLLEPFTQEEEGSRRQYEGAGLGLTYAYKMTTLMGGTFNIFSKKGSGTTIRIEFPLAEEHA